VKPLDYLKAVGVGLAALALNLALTTAAIFAYAMLIEPGRPADHYTAMAPKIAAWTAPIGGALLMFAAAYGLARRRPQRPAVAFGLAVFVAYAFIDAASGLPMGGLKALMTPVFAISMTLALLGALAGGALAARRRT
jgi:peptidoglycan/LPS O-acetylase OafA/YrhL